MRLDSKQIKDNLKIQKYCMIMPERTAIFSLLTSSTDCPINSVHSLSHSRNFVLSSFWLTITSSLYLATHITVSKWVVNEGHTNWKGVHLSTTRSLYLPHAMWTGSSLYQFFCGTKCKLDNTKNDYPYQFW